MPMRFIHVVAYRIVSSFVFPCSMTLCEDITIIFVCFPVNGHLGCFQFRAIVHKSAVDMLVCAIQWFINLGIEWLLSFSRIGGYVMVSHWGFYLDLPLSDYAEHLFLFLSNIWISSFVQCLLESFVHFFKNWVVCLFIIALEVVSMF